MHEKTDQIRIQTLLADSYFVQVTIYTQYATSLAVKYHSMIIGHFISC